MRTNILKFHLYLIRRHLSYLRRPILLNHRIDDLFLLRRINGHTPWFTIGCNKVWNYIKELSKETV